MSGDGAVVVNRDIATSEALTDQSGISVQYGPDPDAAGEYPTIFIQYVPDPSKFVDFKKFKLRSFKDSLTANYSSEDVFGRMDPIMTYQGTGRNITLGFDLGTDGPKVMSKYLAMVSRLMQMQYPVYEDAANALSLSRPPLVRVKFGNYIRSGTGGSLLCALKGVSYSPFDKFDLAFSPSFVANDAGVIDIIPRRISVDLDLVVLHETTPAFQDIDDKGITWIGGDQFPKVDYDSKYGSKHPAGMGMKKGLSVKEIAKANEDLRIPAAEAEKIAGAWQTGVDAQTAYEGRGAGGSE